MNDPTVTITLSRPDLAGGEWVAVVDDGDQARAAVVYEPAATPGDALAMVADDLDTAARLVAMGDE